MPTKPAWYLSSPPSCECGSIDRSESAFGTFNACACVRAALPSLGCPDWQEIVHQMQPEGGLLHSWEIVRFRKNERAGQGLDGQTTAEAA